MERRTQGSHVRRPRTRLSHGALIFDDVIQALWMDLPRVLLPRHPLISRSGDPLGRITCQPLHGRLICYQLISRRSQSAGRAG
jgi:hypothetical protein